MKGILLFLLVLLVGTPIAQAVNYWLTQPNQSLPGAINGQSGVLQVSANGRYLSFASNASNWTQGDLNGMTDFFVHDLQTGQVQLASTTGTGQQLFSGDLFYGSQVSDDGQTFLFLSDSMELPDADGVTRVYAKNLNTGAVSNESEYGGGSYYETSYVQMSSDGVWMYFATAAMIDPLHNVPVPQVYRKNLADGTYELISTSVDGMAVADETAAVISVSPNGRYVVLRTAADNMLGTFDQVQLVLKDMDTDTYELITQQPNGDPSATTGPFEFGFVSNTGVVLFQAGANDLVVNDTNFNRDLFIYSNDLVERITLDSNGQQVADPELGQFAFSGDGETVVFVSDSEELISGLVIGPNGNEIDPVYRYEVSNGELEVLTAVGNVVADGRIESLALSQTGEFWMVSSQTGLPGIGPLTRDEFNGVLYHYDAVASEFSRPVAVAYDPNTVISDMLEPVMSNDQRWLLAATSSPNLSTEQGVEAGFTLMLLDRYTNQWEVIGRDVRSFSGQGAPYDISGSGRYVVFRSSYFQPTAEIDLGANQIFLLDRDTGIYSQITEGSDPRVNDDGLVVFSTSDALVAEDLNNREDIYLFDVNTSILSLVSVNPATQNAGNNSSSDPDIGGTGTTARVVFSSRATDLTGNPDTNSSEDVFTKLLTSNSIERASEVGGVGGDGTSEYPRISNQGNVIVYRTRSENLTMDDYSDAWFHQVIHYDVDSAINTLASFNQSNLPLEGRMGTRGSGVVSASGRFVVFAFDDQGVDDDFNGDDDNESDVVLVDMMNGESKVVSDFFFTGINTDEANHPYIAEDDSDSPSLVGVSFNSRRLLSQLFESPGHYEIYMYQEGGEETTISVKVEGQGIVTGTLGVNCQDQCDYDFTIESSVSLVAIPDPGQVFYAWQDALSSCDRYNPACQIDVDDRPRSLTAIFLDENDIIFNDGFE